jgi:hypothetical protein
MQHAMEIDLRYSDLMGAPIDRFRNYTLKVLKLDLRLENENWEDLKAISAIRNSLVHGEIEKKPLINKFCKRNNLPDLLRGEVISLNFKYLSVIILICRLFVERIYVVALETFPGKYEPKNKA